MRIARVVGNVTLNRNHPVMKGATYKIVVPLSLDALLGREAEDAEELVAYDELGAAPGQLIAISEGREAAVPFYPDAKPIDAYNAAILDSVNVSPIEELK